MCFVLFAASSSPLPLIPWSDDIPRLCVESVASDAAMRDRFTLPHIASIGSSSHCGCNFRRAFVASPIESSFVAKNSRLPGIMDGVPWINESEGERNENAELASYLRPLVASGASIELYGCWDGDESEAAEFTLEGVCIEDIEHRFLIERVLMRVTKATS